MSDAGVLIVNDFGTTLVDDSSCVLALVAKGVGAVPPAGSVAPVTVTDANGVNYVFDVVTSPSTAGFVIWTKPGSVSPIAFDALKNNARVVDTFGGINMQDGLGVRNYTAGRTYAAGLLQNPEQLNWTSSSPTSSTWHLWAMQCAVSGASVTVSRVEIDTGREDGIIHTSYGNGPWQAIVLDVTGY